MVETYSNWYLIFYVGNPKGLSGPLKGGVIIEYLAARLGFT